MVCAGVHRNPALPITRAQSDQHQDAAIPLNSPVGVAQSTASDHTAACVHETEPATSRTLIMPAVMTAGAAAGGTDQTGGAQSAQTIMPELSLSPGAQPVPDLEARSPRAGLQPAHTTSSVGEANESARAALPDESQSGAHVSGSPALASIRTSLAYASSEAGQSKTPASHRISDVGSEEADEAVTPPAFRQAGASSTSCPTTPAAAYLTPR